MQPQYKVKDTYEDNIGEFLGYANTWQECKEIAKEQIEQTDGECHVVALPLNKETGKYSWNNSMLVRV